MKATQMVMSAGQAQSMFFVKDRRIYNEEGFEVDSNIALKMTKTYEYTLGTGQINKQGERKRILFKVKPEQRRLSDSIITAMLAPKSVKLKRGELLDLSPFGDRIDKKKVAGKAIMIIFWRQGFLPIDAYAELNEVVEKHIAGGKFELYAVTHLPYDEAVNALKTTPISNAHQMFDSEQVTKAYDCYNQPVLVLTDKAHKITFAITNNPAQTPRIVDGLLQRYKIKRAQNDIDIIPMSSQGLT